MWWLQAWAFAGWKCKALARLKATNRIARSWRSFKGKKVDPKYAFLTLLLLGLQKA